MEILFLKFIKLGNWKIKSKIPHPKISKFLFYKNHTKKSRSTIHKFIQGLLTFFIPFETFHSNTFFFIDLFHNIHILLGLLHYEIMAFRWFWFSVILKIIEFYAEEVWAIFHEWDKILPWDFPVFVSVSVFDHFSDCEIVNIHV